MTTTTTTHYLSVLAILKNETMNLNVWLDHYLWQGVEHFFLIDNGSTDNPLKILQPYIDRGIVTYQYHPEKHQQAAHYGRMFDTARIREQTFWLCVCDLDEFFYGTHASLHTILREMETTTDVIYSPWKMFGHEHLREHPPDIRTAIVHRNPELERQHTKYICKTSVVTDSSMVWIHYLRMPHQKEGCIPMSFTKRGPRLCIEDDRIQLNHYPIQSLQFFQQVKMTRGAADDVAHEHVRDMNFFQNRVTNCVHLDDQLKRLVEHGYDAIVCR
jgi:hypothetical protein